MATPAAASHRAGVREFRLAAKCHRYPTVALRISCNHHDGADEAGCPLVPSVSSPALPERACMDDRLHPDDYRSQWTVATSARRTPQTLPVSHHESDQSLALLVSQLTVALGQALARERRWKRIAGALRRFL